MPDWAMPQDVVFDYGAAYRAADAVAELRFVLANAARTESGAARSALAQWDGLSAERFALSLRARRNDYGALDADLRSLELAVLDAAADALREQRRVELAQAEWLALERAEQLAAAEEASRAAS